LTDLQTGEELGISKLLWLAPELLRDRDAKATQKGDVYSFAIICYEMFRRPEFEEGPFVDVDLTENQILENIRDPRKNDFTTTRPVVENLKNKEFCNRIGVIEPPITAISKKLRSHMAPYFFGLPKIWAQRNFSGPKKVRGPDDIWDYYITSLGQML
jgi:serine/threonine protein kinase